MYCSVSYCIHIGTAFMNIGYQYANYHTSNTWSCTCVRYEIGKALVLLYLLQ